MFWAGHSLSSYLVDRPRVWNAQLLHHQQKPVRTLMPGPLRTDSGTTLDVTTLRLNLYGKQIQSTHSSRTVHTEGCGQWRYLHSAMNVSIIQNPIDALFFFSISSNALHVELWLNAKSIQRVPSNLVSKNNFHYIRDNELQGLSFLPELHDITLNILMTFSSFHYIINIFWLNPVISAF